MPVIQTVFVGGGVGDWIVRSATAVSGEALPPAGCVTVRDGRTPSPDGAAWTMVGVAGHARYVMTREQAALAAVSPPLGRQDSTTAALIPIRKAEAWWALAQDERRAIIAERSRHIELGMGYLPAIARRLYHCRDLGGAFDFLTWFEFDPADEPVFDELVGLLRATEEWAYVDREVDLRLARSDF